MMCRNISIVTVNKLKYTSFKSIIYSAVILNHSRCIFAHLPKEMQISTIQPVFKLELNHKVTPSVAIIAKYDGTHPCLTASAGYDKVSLYYVCMKCRKLILPRQNIFHVFAIFFVIDCSVMLAKF